jgi:bifunctional enzyme CysN/CysC
VTFAGSVEAAESGDTVTLTLANELDIARGDVLALPKTRPELSEQFAAHVIWMDREPVGVVPPN